MAQPFPKHEHLMGGYEPLRTECDAPDLVIEGEVPAELRGVFMRNGPNPQYAPRGEYHLFAGDGMLHGFYIADGKVAYKNRWVQTIKWRKEREAGRALFSGMNPMDADPSVLGMPTDGLASTNVVWHGKNCWRLKRRMRRSSWTYAHWRRSVHTLLAASWWAR